MMKMRQCKDSQVDAMNYRNTLARLNLDGFNCTIKYCVCKNSVAIQWRMCSSTDECVYQSFNQLLLQDYSLLPSSAFALVADAISLQACCLNWYPFRWQTPMLCLAKAALLAL